jgi:hypothetical protein
MKNINIPKFFFILWIILFAIFLVSAIIVKDLAASLLFVAPFLLPLSLVILLVHKIFTKKDKNSYFLISIILYALSTIVIFYIWSHAFDNFMSLS